jgi:hypothetical protein
MVEKTKSTYSVITGLWKSLKNVAIVIGVPAILFLINNYAQWLPESYNTVALPIIGFISYFIKNYIENK